MRSIEMATLKFIPLVSMVIVVQAATFVCGMHIRIEYGNFEHLTCYTCHQNKNNEDCNSWAPNIPCPMNHTVCMTIHRFDKTTGESKQVDKMCTYPAQCTLEHVGCHDNEAGNEIECVTCCTKSFCNTVIAYNTSTSIELSSDLVIDTGNHAISPSLEVFNVLISLIVIMFV